MIRNSSLHSKGHTHTLRSGSTRWFLPSINIQELPDEVLFAILEFVDVLDTVVLYKVSKLFYRLLQDDLFWRAAYKNRRLPRPPGPHEGHSPAHLREILVKSARVQRNWPPFIRSPCPTSRVVLKSARHHLSMLHGRWIITGDPPLLLCYDTHSSNPDWDTTSKIFYRPHLTANFFHCCSAIGEDGQELIFAVSDTQVGGLRRKLNLFTVQIAPGYGPFISGQVLALDLRPTYSGVWTVTIGPRLLIISARGPEREDPPVILDVKTFQRFRIVPPSLPHIFSGEFTSFISTSSHLLVARSVLGSETLLQVFPISQTHSELSTDVIRILRPSHVLRTPELECCSWHLLRKPTYESLTGGTCITLLVSVAKRTPMVWSEKSLNILHLLLGAGGNTSFRLESLRDLPPDASVLADSSHDGCIRGIVHSGNGRILMPFMVDDQDKYNSTRLLNEFTNVTLPFRNILFDGYRGVLCSVVAGEPRGWHIEIVRFA